MELTPQNPCELLTMMASTSTQIDVFSDGVIESVQRGEINPLTVLIQLRAMEKASGRILKEIAPNLLKESDMYPGTEFEFDGNKITKTEHGTKYDYSYCGDPVYEFRKQSFDSAKESMNEREAFLKALKSPITMVDELSGEIVTIKPPTNKSTSGLNVSIR